MSERTLMSATVNVRPAEARTQVSRGRRKVTGRAWTPWLMLAPALVMLGTFVLYPAVHAIWLSLTSTNLINTAAEKFVGFANYAAVFSNPTTYTALWHSAIWTFGNVFFQLVLGMIIALALNQKIRGRGPIRAIVLVPWATSSILVSLMWGWMLDPNLGIINHILHAIGVQGAPFAWLGTQATALPTLMFIDIWQGVPFFAVMRSGESRRRERVADVLEGGIPLYPAGCHDHDSPAAYLDRELLRHHPDLDERRSGERYIDGAVVCLSNWLPIVQLRPGGRPRCAASRVPRNPRSVLHSPDPEE